MQKPILAAPVHFYDNAVSKSLLENVCHALDPDAPTGPQYPAIRGLTGSPDFTNSRRTAIQQRADHLFR
jgi:hypothetical protein